MAYEEARATVSAMLKGIDRFVKYFLTHIFIFHSVLFMFDNFVYFQLNRVFSLACVVHQKIQHMVQNSAVETT